MSELWFYLRPKPALEPITTKGNWFWRDGERLLIKGIDYFLRESPYGTPATPGNSKMDPLTDEHLDDLRRDIDLFHELRLNTISVSYPDPTKSHHKALKLLAESDIYVVVTIGKEIAPPSMTPANRTAFDQHFDTKPYYTSELITPSLRLIDEVADYPNVLGFNISGSSIVLQSTTKIAEVVRAMIRDVKAFLKLRGGRTPPVGVQIRDMMMLRKSALQYFTAGIEESRADFFALECYSWMYKSSFQISGWKGMVERLGDVPAPMFLGQYGAQNGKARIWEEVECLYSPDMTGVFSGGCVYTLHEYGNNYGIVKFNEEGILRRKKEFATLKKKFEVVGRRDQEQLWQGGPKDYEGWRGKYPEIAENRWMATENLPEFPLDWIDLPQSLRLEQ